MTENKVLLFKSKTIPLSRNRRPLDTAETFADRLIRIREALIKINAILADTKHNIVESPKVISETTDKINMATKEPTK